MSKLALQLIAENKQTKSPRLNLGNCGLTELPKELFQCVWLEELIFINKSSFSLTKEKRTVKRIKKRNKLTVLPFEISYLQNLKVLAIGGDGGDSPCTIQNLGILKKLPLLNILHLPYIELADTDFLNDLPGLTYLSLRGNLITNTDFLKNLKLLRGLDLYDNEIEYIDNWSEISKDLSILTRLDLSHNHISNISGLKEFTSLQQLYLVHNTIRDILSLEKLTNLQELDLRYNKVSDIPSGLIENTGLELVIEDVYPTDVNGMGKMYLSGNPLVNPPIEILRQGREFVMEYFRGDKKALNECKLIFVGEGGVGKTSLMRRIVSNIFNENEKPTHGINKIAWQEITNEKGETIKVNLWDFGGQHIQHSLHQFFFSERVIYVLVLNPRNDERAHYWLDQIEKLGWDSKILIVYNWKDHEDKDAKFLNNFYELRKKYPQISDPFILSCKEGDGVAAFKTVIKDKILGSEGLKTQYRKEWFNIKERLEKEVPIETHYIEYEKYEEWCREEKFNDPATNRSLLNTLNSIGSIVFFDIPILNQLQILNPEWITTGAYAILTASRTNDNKGHLSWNDLIEIFKEEKVIFSNKEFRIKYTEKQFLFIIQLMLEYKLCQENPFNKFEYLIPAAFGEKPQKSYEDAKINSQHYRIQFKSPFEMLIIHRFIAMNIVNLIDKDYWNSGIYIKHSNSNTFALIETNLYSNQIDCWIKGENIRGFWEIIRDDFRKIFSKYHNFQYDEEVYYPKGGQNVFLPYKEMIDAIKNGVTVIDYHPTYQLKNINVLEVLELFEEPDQTRKVIEQDSNKFEFNPHIEVNPHIEFKPNINNIVNNNIKVELAGNTNLEELKECILDLEELNVEDQTWKEELRKILDELHRLEGAEDKAVQKTSVSKIDRLFKKLKDVKDIVAIATLPADIATKGAKMVLLWEGLRSLFT